MPFHEHDDDVTGFAIIVGIMFVLGVVIIAALKCVQTFL